MSQSPGLYIDIGKKARDLLYKDYGDQQPPNHFRYDCFDSNFDLSCRCNAIVPGLSTAFRSIIPDSGRVELRYLHDYAGVTAGIGLKANHHHNLSVGLDRIVNFSVVTGNTLLSIGTNAAFDISTRTFSNYSAGLSFNTAFYNTSLTLNDNLDNIKASYYQELVPLTRTAVAAELKHSFSRNGSISDDNVTIPTTLTVGFQHGLLPSTLVKVRVNTDGKVGAHVQQAFWQKFSIAISGETDIKATSWVPNLRFSMAFSS